MIGKFIVLDGTDGSGKGTQTKLLSERLKEENYNVKMVDFPQYGNWSSQFVEKYLRGEFGGVTQVSAKKASLFYALDRFAASSEMQKHLLEEGIIISNRYVSANKGHQLGKIRTSQEMHQFLDWINELEYSILEIPVPDLTIFLHMTAEIGQKLVDQKEERKYIQGKKRDIHEADINHLKNAEKAFHFCLDNDNVESWKKVTCYQGSEPRSIEDIHEDIYNLVTKILPQNSS